MMKKLLVLSVYEDLSLQRRINLEFFMKGMQNRGNEITWRVLEMYHDTKKRITQMNSVMIPDGLWQKEAGLNYLYRSLVDTYSTFDFDYIAWVDADVSFTNPYWVEETISALSKHKVVQMFSWAQNIKISENFWTIGEPRPGYYFQYSEMKNIIGGIKFKDKNDNLSPTVDAHPGFAWAVTREVWEATNGLLDWNIMSGGDFVMAAAYLGKLTEIMEQMDFSIGYVNACSDWEAKAANVVDGNIGFVPGLVHHYWHGPANRNYHTPVDMFQKYKFDPTTDIRKNNDGFYYFTGHNIPLEEAVSVYVTYRNKI